MKQARHKRRTDRSVEPFVVVTDDGTSFRCSVSSIGREAEPRWVLIDADGEQFVGPPVLPDKSPAAVTQLVNEWWQRTKGAR